MPFLAFMSMLRYICFQKLLSDVASGCGFVIVFSSEFKISSLHERHFNHVSPTGIHAMWPFFLVCNLYFLVVVVSIEIIQNLARVALESCPP